MFIKKPEDEDEVEPHYFSLELAPEQRALILNALERHPHVSGVRRATIERVQLAQRWAGECPSPVRWDRLEAEAEQRGESLADLAWDKSKGLPEPSCPPIPRVIFEPDFDLGEE